MLGELIMTQDQISLEKMNLSSFTRQFVVSRKSEIPSMVIQLDDPHLQLPDVSSLHTTRGFLEYPTEITDITPDLDNPLYQHERLRKYLYFQTEIPTSKSRPYPVVDRYQFMPAQLRGLINHFFSTNSEFHRTIDPMIVDKSQSLLACYEYGPILRTIVRGQLWDYRKFDILMRTILTTIVETKFPRHHFIEIPVSSTLYTQSEYVKPLQKVTASTLKNILDPSFYFMLHLFGYALNNVEPQKEVDVPLNDVGYLTKKDMSQYTTDSLFNRLPEGKQNEIYVILRHQHHGIIYHLPLLREYTSSTSYLPTLIKQLNVLKLIASKKHTQQDLSQLKDEELDKVIEEEKNKQDKDKQTSQTVPEATTLLTSEVPKEAEVFMNPKKPVTFEKPHVVEKTVNKNAFFLNHLNEGTKKAVEKVKAENGSNVNYASKSEVLIQKQMALTIGGKTISEHLSTPDPVLESSTLEFLENSLPDKSMAKSTIANFDKTYLKHVAMKDLCRVLTSFNKSGLFITDIKETPQINKFNRILDYRIKLHDLNGKQHTINFQFPMVDENGTMLVNGIQSQMIKQNVDVPICKIDENRVSLASNYNKTIVQRSETVAHSFGHWIGKYLTILINQGVVKVEYGKLLIDATPLPYEYQVLSQHYLDLQVKGYKFILNYPERFKGNDEKHLSALEHHLGIYSGEWKEGYLFWDKNNTIHQTDKNGKILKSFFFIELLHSLVGDVYNVPKLLSEWCEIKILDLNIPVVFVLGFEYGLRNVFKDIKLDYKFIPSGERVNLKLNEIAIKFADGTLIFNRYPLEKSLIASGLGKWDMSGFGFSEFDSPEGYYALLESRSIKVNYLKGISAFYEFFIDPITEEVLVDMHEPTTMKGLMIKAVELLSDMSYYPTSSMRHHRLRGYERFACFLYNEVARELASYKEKRNQKSGFSINPKSVFSRIVSDQTVHNLDVINPVHELKGLTNLTYSGHNGRTGQSFVLEDRVYAKDARGIISESTPDSGKVAINAFTSFNPRIKDIRGLCEPCEDETHLDPTNMLSAPALLMPGTTQDDGKRANFVGIQLSHHVPCENSDVGFIRTGFELTMAHRVSDTFAAAALDDGEVVSFDEKTKVFVVKYKDTPIKPDGRFPSSINVSKLFGHAKNGETISIAIGEKEKQFFPIGKKLELSKTQMATVTHVRDDISLNDVPQKLLKERPDLIKYLQQGKESHVCIVTFHIGPHVIEGEKRAYRFGDLYTSVSGTQIKQPLAPLVKLHDKVKKGDVLLYNKGFFTPEYNSKQIRWNHGVLATTVLMEKSETLEDGSIISQNLGQKLMMCPAHKRTIHLLNTDTIKKIVKLHEVVESSDSLLVFENEDLHLLTQHEDEESAAFWRTLDQKAPKARFHGHIAEIEVFHACEFSELSPSIQQIVKEIEKRAKDIQSSMQNASNASSIPITSRIPLGTKYAGIEFTNETVVFEFTISEELPAGTGDKIVIGGPNKSVISAVMERQYYTESGIPVDAVYGTTAAAARIVNSIYILGIGNRIGRELQRQAVEMYFDKK